MKKAFTLAEILISMTIIGVISLLMIPVMQNTQLKSLETATAHFYSMMSQAVKQYMLDNDATNLSSTPMYVDNGSINWSSPNSQSANQELWEQGFKEVDNFIYKYLNVKKVCDYDNRYDCFSEKIFNLTGKSDKFWLERTGEKSYVLSNGAVVAILPPDYWWPAVIQVDINGKKGPNTAGRDIWEMNIYADGVISEKLHMHQMQNKGKINETVQQRQKDEIDYRFGEVCYDGEASFWHYGGGCFMRFEANGFKFDY